MAGERGMCVCVEQRIMRVMIMTVMRITLIKSLPFPDADGRAGEGEGEARETSDEGTRKTPVWGLWERERGKGE